MFRFETIVGIVIAFTCSAAQAADPSPASILGALGADSKCTKYMALMETQAGQTQIDNLAKSAYGKLYATDPAGAKSRIYADMCAANSNDGEACKTATPDFKKAKEEFVKSCGPGGFPTSGSSSNWPGCALAVEKCRKCGSGNHANTDSSDNIPCDANVSSEDTGSTRSADGTPMINTDRMQRVAEYCPASAAKSQKDLNKKFDDSRKDVRDLEKKQQEATKKYTEAKNKAEDEAAQARDKLGKAQGELDQGLADAKKKMGEGNQQLAAEVMQMEQQIAQVNDQIRKMGLKKTEAEMQFNEAIQQIELNCHNSASQTVSKMQLDRLSRPFNRGNFQNMAKAVGLSDRDSWIRRADVYYRRCLASSPTKASKRSAKANYDNVLGQADSEIDKLNGDKQRLIASEQKLKDRNCKPQMGAMPDADQSKACSMIEEAQSEAARLNRKFGTAAEQAALEEQKAMKKGNNEAGVAGMEAAQAQQQLADEKKRMANLRRAYEIADEAANKSSDDPKAHEDALSKYDKFKSQAVTYVDCLKKNGTGCGSTDCREAEGFLTNLGINTMDTNDMSSTIGGGNRAPNPAPPATPPSTNSTHTTTN